MSRLRDLREDKDLTQAEVGKAVGMSAMAISYYERGTRALTAELIMKFCDLFGVTADYLLGRSNHPRAAVSDADAAILAAYHAAPAEIRAIIDTALEPYKQEDQGISAVS